MCSAPGDGDDAPMGERVHLTVEGPIATITNDNPDKHNAFDDEMDAQLFEILAELRGRRPRSAR